MIGFDSNSMRFVNEHQTPDIEIISLSRKSMIDCHRTSPAGIALSGGALLKSAAYAFSLCKGTEEKLRHYDKPLGPTYHFIRHIATAALRRLRSDASMSVIQPHILFCRNGKAVFYVECEIDREADKRKTWSDAFWYLLSTVFYRLFSFSIPLPRFHSTRQFCSID